MNLFNNRVELYWTPTSWCHPGDWVFSCYRMECASYEATGRGCLIIELGFISLYINRKVCRGLTDERLKRTIKEIEEQDQ